MSSEKDDVKAPGNGENEAESQVDPNDDPSLEEDETAVVTDEELKQAEETLADAADSDESSDDADDADDDADATEGDADDDADATEGDEDDDADATEGDEDEESDEDGEDSEEAGQMSLLDHLGELRFRLTRAFIAIAIGMVACYGFAEQMFDILMEPMIKVFQEQAAQNPVLSPEFFRDFGQMLTQSLADKGFAHTEQMSLFMDALQQSLMQVTQQGHFQYTYPAEAFFSHIKISIVAGLFLVSPYVFAQIWGFIAPGLYAHERKWMVPMAIISALFFTSGALFGYFVVFPFGFEFFAGFSTEGIQFTPKLNEYLSFCLKLLFAFGFVFELPLFIFFLARMGMVSSAGLRKKRKYAILIGFVMAAILTPPDPFTQCLMAGPLIILYEVGIWVAYFFGKKEKRHLKKQAEQEAAAQAELDAVAAETEETTEKA
ncbi:twin-arginine translocase subunit TatC [Pseudodesulfovibrio sp. JC047]|uniref:twin-arginine translocase subunit TatC n=1 Tax=Pseudodesulfovibrio sp. JC047 TaxID=2683199 RepID=UPI0013D0D2A5|nr:twin-arginine translocase subunit TatC [Pseudodesulfovibrio sp. JC047]NDV18026.1 twin-arginine translocase subunit TatC [Pseudodesulfovibrio sp. JC047]